MIDLSKHKVDLICPSCKFINPVTLKQVKIRDVIICRGCKSNIQLQDHLNSVRKSLKSFRREMDSLMKAFDGIGSITINL
jgi:hypothetical protein